MVNIYSRSWQNYSWCAKSLYGLQANNAKSDICMYSDGWKKLTIFAWEIIS